MSSPFEPLDDAGLAALARFEHYREQRRRLVLASHRLHARDHLAGLLLARIGEPATTRDAERRVGLLRAQADAVQRALDHPGALAWFDLVARRAHARVFRPVTTPTPTPTPTPPPTPLPAPAPAPGGGTGPAGGGDGG
jgi:hypothetical protein